tara:strand:+ start:1025 stop:2116 length:1092 start_codon:yes stop_codon:yes gene_type:complete
MADSSALNQIFSAHLDSPEGKEKLAQVAQAYLRDKLRENAFARKILPPAVVTKADLQVSVSHDTMVFIDEIEPNSKAVSMTFRGQPSTRYIEGQRYEIAMHTISSERFEKTEQELLAYRMPITKIIEDNAVKDIQEIEDHRFITHCRAAVEQTGLKTLGEQATADVAANGPGTNFEGVLQRNDLVKLFKLLDGTRRRLAKVLMNEINWDDCLTWTIEDYGDTVQGKVAVDGYTYDRIMGRMIVRTIKTDILQQGDIYGFTAPDMLGKFLILNNTKFYIDKVANLIMFQAYEDVGIGLGNISSIAKLRLYNRASDKTMVAEDAVGGSSVIDQSAGNTGAALSSNTTGVFNEAAAGNTFPKVDQF